MLDQLGRLGDSRPRVVDEARLRLLPARPQADGSPSRGALGSRSAAEERGASVTAWSETGTTGTLSVSLSVGALGSGTSVTGPSSTGVNVGCGSSTSVTTGSEPAVP